MNLLNPFVQKTNMRKNQYNTVELTLEDIQACVTRTLRSMGMHVNPHNVVFSLPDSYTSIKIKARLYGVRVPLAKKPIKEPECVTTA